MLRVLGCGLLLTLALIGPIRAETASTKLRLTIQVAANEPFLGAPVVQFKNDVERETANAVSIEIFDKGKLYIDNQVVDAVKSGAIEMGVAGINQITKIVPAASIMEQPFVFNFDALVRAATSPDSEIRQLIDNAVVQALGLHVLWWETIGRQVFLTKSGDIRLPDQIKGMKIRAFSETMAKFVKDCGGVPLNMSISDVHRALENGTLDMTMTSVAAVQTRDLWQVTRAITRTDHATIEFLVVINEKVWQSLSDELKRIIMEAARKVEHEARARASLLEAAAYDFARSKGMKIYDLTPGEVAEWRACSTDVTTAYVDKGGELTQRLMKAYARLRTQPCCSAGPSTDALNGEPLDGPQPTSVTQEQRPYVPQPYDLSLTGGQISNRQLSPRK